MPELLTDELANKLGLTKEVGEEWVSYLKEVSIEFGFYKCRIAVIQNKYVSIYATNNVCEHDILLLMYVPDQEFLLSVMGRLTKLKYLFPEIMLIP